MSRCRVCGRDAERVLSSAELLRAAALIVEARARGEPVLDFAAAVVPSRLAALQLIECLAGLLDRREFVREELGRAVEAAELDEAFEEPAAEGPVRRPPPSAAHPEPPAVRGGVVRALARRSSTATDKFQPGLVATTGSRGRRAAVNRTV